ncbi:MAG: hypothetical protein AAF310_02170, partial [Myxococcota bacterium]
CKVENRNLCTRWLGHQKCVGANKMPAAWNQLWDFKEELQGITCKIFIICYNNTMDLKKERE